jgi:transcriptional regulator with XRE-family HTH domain
MPCEPVVRVLPGSGRISRRTNGQPTTMHRLKTVRHQQGVSLRSVARALKIDVHEARRQEEETTDLPLSTLYQWRDLLDVPVGDLLVESPELSPPVLARARLVKLMKTATAIRDESNHRGVRQLAEMLIEQLIEIMPELKDVSPWHLARRRRRVRVYGRILERSIPDTFFGEY